MQWRFVVRSLFRLLLILAFYPVISNLCALDNGEKWDRVYLATYPRCGNHWLRSLLEEATHIATSSVYRDIEPMHLKKPFPWGGYAVKNGLEGNCRYPEPGEIVVIKTHYPAKPVKKFDLRNAKKIIRIVRHPVDSFYSHYIHFDQHKIPLDGKIPSTYVKQSVKNWKKFEKYWNKDVNTFTVRYEDMLADIDFYLREIITVIGYQLDDADIERAIQKFPSRGGSLQHLGDYHPEDLKYIEKELGELMNNYGYTI